MKARWYYGLKAKIKMKEYPRFLDEEINVLMRHLVNEKDKFYLELLNECGDKKFCRFHLTDEHIYNKRGLYLYALNGRIMYIGRCLDNFANRFNNNYGMIAPRNCYKGGQSTNTHINSLVNYYGHNIEIYLCILLKENEIIQAEKLLIDNLNPEWNRRK